MCLYFPRLCYGSNVDCICDRHLQFSNTSHGDFHLCHWIDLLPLPILFDDENHNCGYLERLWKMSGTIFVSIYIFNVAIFFSSYFLTFFLILYWSFWLTGFTWVIIGIISIHLSPILGFVIGFVLTPYSFVNRMKRRQTNRLFRKEAEINEVHE